MVASVYCMDMCFRYSQHTVLGKVAKFTVTSITYSFAFQRVGRAQYRWITT